MFKEKLFFDTVRTSLFNGRLSSDQFEGMARVLAHYEASGWTDLRWLAYLLATDYHETAYTMQPIREYGSDRYLKSKPYYPWYGRGLVMITWEENYKRMGEVLGKDFTTNPDVVLEWDSALPIIFEGMTFGISKRGDFTGKALEHYFNKSKDDPVGARAIVNGTDKAVKIAGHHDKFLAALQSSWIEKPIITSDFYAITSNIRKELDELERLYGGKDG